MMNKDNVEDIRTQFTKQADAYAATAQARDEASHMVLVELCQPAPEARVLDVACGPGFLTMAFAGRCREVVGLDATDAMLSMARSEAEKRGMGNVRFEKGIATELPFTSASFDIVSCRAAFHHFPNPGLVLAEMSRVIKTCGKILIADTVTSEDPMEADMHNEIERLCDPTHVKALTATELRNLLRMNRLDIITDLPGRMTYDLDGWILHGGPSAEIEMEIRRRFEEALKKDNTGLRVRVKEGRILFTHQTLVIVAVSKADLSSSSQI
jgi:ubiquinone/menaquinone biosynthesis C-methylase UbiE